MVRDRTRILAYDEEAFSVGGEISTVEIVQNVGTGEELTRWADTQTVIGGDIDGEHRSGEGEIERFAIGREDRPTASFD